MTKLIILFICWENMKKILKKQIVIVVVAIFMSLSAFGQVKVYETFDKFEQELILNRSADTTYIVNFWATWCAPCVKELPYFEELLAMYEDQPFRQILVSLDAVKSLDKRVVPFLKKNNIASEVVLLADGRANKWIDKIDPSWSGAIPITLILRGTEKRFYEKEFHSVEELEEEFLDLFNNH